MEKHIAPNKRIYFGVFLIALGVFWILERLGLIPDFWDDVLISWQMLLIGIGIFSIIGGNKTSGTVLIVIGGFFLVPEVAHIPDELRRIGWPLLIIGIGVVLLITHGRKKGIEEPPTAESGNNSMDYFDDFVVFGGREVFVDSQNFYGGKSTSMFGGAEYDLRQANLSPNGAVVDCVTVFGACGFKVPPDWTVKNEVTAIFGAFADKRGTSLNHVVSNPSKTLIIKGFCAFGAVEIKHF
jgi:predicted membrane protein